LRGSHSWKYEGKMFSKEGTELELLETGAYESFPVLRKKWITETTNKSQHVQLCL